MTRIECLLGVGVTAAKKVGAITLGMNGDASRMFVVLDILVCSRRASSPGGGFVK